MPIIKTLALHIKTFIPNLTIFYTFSFALLVFVVFMAQRWHWPIGHFTRDLATTFHTHPFTGMVSNIGVLFWCSTAVICIFSSLLLSNKDKSTAKFLLFSGLFTLVLLVDDLFMFHDYVLPVYLGFPEEVVYLGYFLTAVTYFLVFSKQILKTEYTILLMACCLLGMSIVCDILLEQDGWTFLAEDGFKLFGIVTWFVYFSRVCFTQFRENPA